MSFPNFTFWSHLLATVGVEVCCLAALGFVAQRLARPAVWQRAVWQMTVICLLLSPASEWTGFGRGTAGFLFGQKRVAEQAPASVFPAVASPPAGQPEAVKLNRPSAATRPAVWWPGWIWLAGTVIVLGRMAAARALLLALRLRRKNISTHSLRERVFHVAHCVGLRRKVSVLWMPQAISPMAFGILRPSLGLPPGFETKLSATEQEAVLAHELAHLAAMDPMWFLLADFASALLWWHPLVWWMRRSLHGAAELAADEAAALVPDGPDALARCLVKLGQEMTAGRGWAWVGINGGFRSQLGKRVERLLRMPNGASRPLTGRIGSAARIAATILVVPAIVLLFGAFQSAQGQKQDDWRGQLRESWNTSPGALLVLAALDDTEKEKPDIASQMRKAKLLYETGKLDESETILVQILKTDPSNKTAPYFLDLIKETRFAANARAREAKAKSPIVKVRTDWIPPFKQDSLPIPNPMAHTNLVYTTARRREILSKLERIRLPEVSYDLPLTEVINRLRIESKKRDPDGAGVNFIINPRADTGVEASPPIDMNQVTIKISPPLQNLRLADVLNAITKSASKPVIFTIEDYGVVFSPKPAEAEVLYTKVFRVDPNTFIKGLQKVVLINLQGEGGLDDVIKTYDTNDTGALFNEFFKETGVDLTYPKIVFFNDRLGEILVRASQKDLEIIQQAIELLDQSPKQLTIEAKFVEADEVPQGIGFDWPGRENEFKAIITDAQFRLALAAIQRRPGMDILSSPKVTTLSSRQTHTASTNADGGVMLDVLPTVGPDGYSIIMLTTPTIKTGKRIWQVSDHCQLWDGETLVIGSLTTNQLPGAKKARLVFITPTIIDRAGNRVHDERDMEVFKSTLQHGVKP